MPTLPPLPKQVDPDRWLATVNRQAFARKVDAHGCVQVDLQTYSIKQELSGQHVVLFVNEPMFRGWWRSLDRLVLNALLLGAAN